jgi:hypothetical protein
MAQKTELWKVENEQLVPVPVTGLDDCKNGLQKIQQNCWIWKF